MTGSIILGFINRLYELYADAYENSFVHRFCVQIAKYSKTSAVCNFFRHITTESGCLQGSASVRFLSRLSMFFVGLASALTRFVSKLFEQGMFHKTALFLSDTAANAGKTAKFVCILCSGFFGAYLLFSLALGSSKLVYTAALFVIFGCLSFLKADFLDNTIKNSLAFRFVVWLFDGER